MDKIDSHESAVALLEEYQQVKEAELGALLRQYDVVDVHVDPIEGSYVILADPNPTVFNSGNGFAEMASVDPNPFTAWTRMEHVPELRDKRGLRTFYDMSRNDGAVRGALRIIKTPIQGGEWYIEAASEAAIDQNIAEFIEGCLFDWIDTTWPRFIEDCLRSIDYGFFAFEKVWEPDFSTGKMKLKRLTPLHPLDIQGWDYAPNGELVGLTLEPLKGQSIYESIKIPYDKVLMIVFEMEGGDLRGTSILRSAFKHWYFKEILYKIDAIQKERHGIGVPVIKLPVGFTNDDKLIAEELGRNLRANERAYITSPANWEIFFAKLEGQPVDPIPSIEHHDKKIYESILAAFMGTALVSSETMDTFYKSTRYIAEGVICATINKWLIKQLVDMNFLRKNGYPKLRVRRMGEWEDTRTMTFALRNLVGAKLVTPDEPIENLLREQMGLPKLDKTTARDISQKAGPGGSGLTPPGQNVGAPQVGLPKQGASPPIGVPQANAGTDRRGSSSP